MLRGAKAPGLASRGTSSRAAQGSPDAMIRLAPLGRFDGKPGADLLQWRADRRLDLQSSAIEPCTLHSYGDEVTKNEVY